MNLANARRKPECRSRRAGDIDHKNIGVKEENCPYGLLAISHGSCDVKVLAQLLTKISEERLTEKKAPRQGLRPRFRSPQQRSESESPANQRAGMALAAVLHRILTWPAAPLHAGIAVALFLQMRSKTPLT